MNEKGGGEMMTRRLNDTSKVSVALFLTLFASQSGVIALSPVLTKVAGDLDVSASTAGQLRTISGLAAGSTALVLARAARRLGLRSLMLAGTGLVAAGSVASSVAPSFEWLALAQAAIGVGVAILLTSATTAAAEWVPDEHRARVLSSALIGQPAAWIVGMPLIGALGQLSWRYGLLAMPLLGSMLAAFAGGPPRHSSGRSQDWARCCPGPGARRPLGSGRAARERRLDRDARLFRRAVCAVVQHLASRHRLGSRRRGGRLRRRERRVPFAGRCRRPAADHPAVARARSSAACLRSDPTGTRSQR